jgi:Ca2+-binding EF-hand superfamily protein
MQKHVLAVTTFAFVLACGVITASAQQEEGGMMGHGMMGRGGMMGPGSMMGSRHPGMMMRMLFALMDSDGDGTITLPEFQAAHERIFKAMDANKDGRLTLDEIQAFIQGTRRSAPQQSQQ